MKYIFTLFLFLNSIFALCQTEFIVNTELLNVRSGPSTDYEVVGQVKLNQKVLEISKSGNWSKIQVDDLQGYVSAKYITAVDANSQSKDNEDGDTFIGWLIALGIIGYIIIKAKNFLSNLFGGSKSSSRPSRNYAPSTPKKVTNYHLSIKDGVVYLGKERSTMQSPVFRGFEKAVDCDLENPTNERSRFLVATAKGEVLLCQLKSTSQKKVFRPFVSFGSAYKTRFADSNSFTFQTEKGLFKGYFNSTKIDKLA
ncbi:SH3 domain-containing protein [Leeuwenhoekiella blandensis]|uniref:N-acetylmuramoyl-L-alanine amidase n=1 Tax=Leeuwenhoekiella blandensis (strain CECT 7118 / CCUG 51940 / KCTC 22103 / MED217) TaxID=398720 RepID=A3XLH2_LEEBM|nr:SH3 domain-containing protein [Leeuwenhoekiella blandensis]EAQ49601.1 N-acetylmuramoyl-L-alanine amidase [Leeuwenhoekiella blandensis MED217]MAO08002.1 SH3 domain-containing protein [Alteromonas sp.]MAY22289.1 SH3 domain-containing protein [Flavobacteriaceae bacterium]|tara:strand:+ start:6853 stop:7614 length:762 start_codon:yes stop_codon:yes gene_type:complete